MVRAAAVMARLSIQPYPVFTFLVRYGALLVYLSMCSMHAITRDAKLGVDIYNTSPCPLCIQLSPQFIAIMSEAPSSEYPITQEVTQSIVPESRPNRVILRCRVSDFDKPFRWYGYPTAVEAYLTWAGRSVTDYKERKHNVFVELLQDPELRQTKFHIIIVFHSLSFDVQDLDQVHHEIFLIRRDDKDEL
jgi:hypothetical protein